MRCKTILTHAIGVKLLEATSTPWVKRLYVVIDHPDDGIGPRRLFVGLAGEVTEQELEQAIDHGKAIATRYLNRRFAAWTNEHQAQAKRAATQKDDTAKHADRFTFRGVVYSCDGPVVHPRSSYGR